MSLHSNTLRSASTSLPTPGSDRSLENMITKNTRRKKKNVFKQAGDRLSDAVNMQIRKRILGPSEITGNS